jgi:hypothetical protein
MAHVIPSAQTWTKMVANQPVSVDSLGTRVRLDPPFTRSQFLVQLCLYDNSVDYISMGTWHQDPLTWRGNGAVRPRRPSDAWYSNVDPEIGDTGAFSVTVLARAIDGELVSLPFDGVMRSVADQWLCFRVTGLERSTEYDALFLHSTKPFVAQRIEWFFGT